MLKQTKAQKGFGFFHLEGKRNFELYVPTIIKIKTNGQVNMENFWHVMRAPLFQTFVHAQIMLAFQCMFVSPIIHSKLQVRFLHLETVVQTNKEITWIEKEAE